MNTKTTTEMVDQGVSLLLGHQTHEELDEAERVFREAAAQGLEKGYCGLIALAAGCLGVDAVIENSRVHYDEDLERASRILEWIESSGVPGVYQQELYGLFTSLGEAYRRHKSMRCAKRCFTCAAEHGDTGGMVALAMLHLTPGNNFIGLLDKLLIIAAPLLGAMAGLYALMKHILRVYGDTIYDAFTSFFASLPHKYPLQSYPIFNFEIAPDQLDFVNFAYIGFIVAYLLYFIIVSSKYRTPWLRRLDKAGRKWLQKAAELSDADAFAGLGYYSYHGIAGKCSKAAAEAYYRQAVDLGSTTAMWRLGKIYQSTAFTVHEEKEAFELYAKAAADGNAEGLYRVAKCYRNGAYVAPNLEKANDYYSKALEAGLTGRRMWKSKWSDFDRLLGRKYYADVTYTDADAQPFVENTIKKSEYGAKAVAAFTRACAQLISADAWHESQVY